MASNQYILTFIAATAILFLSSVESEQINPAALCAKTEYPALCNSILKNVQGGSQQALETNIQATVLQVTHAMTNVKKLAPTANTRNAKTCLGEANRVYGMVVEELATALQAMKTKDKGTIDSNIGAALADFSTINDCYTNFPDLSTNPLEKVNAVLKEFTSNSLDLLKELKF